MKHIILFTVCLLIVASASNAQEVIFPNSVLTGGGKAVKSEKIEISKWRIGSVNVLYIDKEQLINNSKSSGINASLYEKINIFPNPVTDNLYLHFDIENSKKLGIEILDNNGRKIFKEDIKSRLPGETIKIDLSGKIPSTYLVHLLTEDNSTIKTFKVIKN